MKEILLIALPLLFAALAFAWPTERTRPVFLPIAGVLHSALALWLLINPPAVPANVWFSFDPLARAVLPMTSLLFLVCSFYGVAYLRARSERKLKLRQTSSSRIWPTGLPAASVTTKGMRNSSVVPLL